VEPGYSLPFIKQHATRTCAEQMCVFLGCDAVNFNIWGIRFYEHNKEEAVNDYVHNFPTIHNYLQQNKFIYQEYGSFYTSRSLMF
jgi:hypothetical protein